MAKYFSLSVSAFANEFAAALETYYGDRVVIESVASNAIVFQCPAICDKVIKLSTNICGVVASIGDSASSVTQFATSYTSGAPTGSGGFHLILADAFILVESKGGTYPNSALVAKLSNGRCVAIGGTNAGASYANGNKACFTDTMVFRAIRMVAPYAGDFRSKGKMCLLPSYVADDCEVELNEDGTFAHIPGMWLAPNTGSPVVGGNYYLSRSGIRSTDGEGIYCYCQKYVELL